MGRVMRAIGLISALLFCAICWASFIWLVIR